MSPSAFFVLKILEADPTCTVSDLAQRLDMTVAGATGLVDRLEKSGLVLRLRDEDDRRLVHVVLSGEGRAALAREGAMRRAILAEWMSTLEPDEVGLLVTLLEKLTRAAGGPGSPVKE